MVNPNQDMVDADLGLRIIKDYVDTLSPVPVQPDVVIKCGVSACTNEIRTINQQRIEAIKRLRAEWGIVRVPGYNNGMFADKDVVYLCPDCFKQRESITLNDAGEIEVIQVYRVAVPMIMLMTVRAGSNFQVKDKAFDLAEKIGRKIKDLGIIPNDDSLHPLWFAIPEWEITNQEF